MSRDAILTFGP